MDRLRESIEESVTRLEVAEGDEVALLVDTDTDASIWRGFFDVIESRRAHPTVVLMAPRAANGLEPTRSADDALSRANVVFALTGASATHTKALKRAAAQGARVCSMPGIDLDIMRAAVMTPDYDAMQMLGGRLAEIFAPAMWMEVTTATGTSLRVAMGGWERMPMVDDGHFAHGMIGNLPAGEVLIVPWEGGSVGTVVVDLAVSCYPKPLAAPVTISFKDGRVSKVEGDLEPAQRVRDLIAQNGANADNFAEMAIGINPHARNTGVLIETEKQFGTAHIGIGNSANIGGTVWAPIHIDVIFDDPTITVDGRVVVDRGEFQQKVLDKESFTDFAPLAGAIAGTAGEVRTRDGKAFRAWTDIQGVARLSQVGDDDTARRASATLASLKSGTALGEDERRVAAVMRLYGLVR